MELKRNRTDTEVTPKFPKAKALLKATVVIVVAFVLAILLTLIISPYSIDKYSFGDPRYYIASQAAEQKARIVWLTWITLLFFEAIICLYEAKRWIYPLLCTGLVGLFYWLLN